VETTIVDPPFLIQGQIAVNKMSVEKELGPEINFLEIFANWKCMFCSKIV